MSAVDTRVSEMLESPLGCAFLLSVEASGLTPEAAVDPPTSLRIAARRVNLIERWSSDHEAIVKEVLEITAGRRVYIGPVLPATGLTARQRDVVQLVALGRDNHAIARELAVTQKTVSNTISAVLSKLGLKDRIELCYYYLGLLDITRHIHPGQFPAETPKLPG